MTLDEFMALAGTSNTGAGEYVSSGTAESLSAVMNAVTVISEAGGYHAVLPVPGTQ